MQGRLFEGYEIQADTIDIPGLGKVPLAKVRPDLDVHPGDAFEVRLRFYVSAPAYATSGMDGKGNFKGEFDRAFKAYADHQEYEVLAYVTKDERDEAFRTAHGAA